MGNKGNIVKSVEQLRTITLSQDDIVHFGFNSNKNTFNKKEDFKLVTEELLNQKIKEITEGDFNPVGDINFGTEVYNWSESHSVVEKNTAALFLSGNGVPSLVFNAYQDGSGWKYKKAKVAHKLSISEFYGLNYQTANTGTVDGSVSWDWNLRVEPSLFVVEYGIGGADGDVDYNASVYINPKNESGEGMNFLFDNNKRLLLDSGKIELLNGSTYLRVQGSDIRNNAAIVGLADYTTGASNFTYAQKGYVDIAGIAGLNNIDNSAYSWDTSVDDILEKGLAATHFTDDGELNFTINAYEDAVGWKRKAGDNAERIRLDYEGIVYQIAQNDVADSTITWETMFYLQRDNYFAYILDGSKTTSGEDTYFEVYNDGIGLYTGGTITLGDGSTTPEQLSSTVTDNVSLQAFTNFVSSGSLLLQPNQAYINVMNSGTFQQERVSALLDGGIEIFSQSNTGLFGAADYSSGYTNNHYVQKLYVDTAVNGATQGIDDVLAIGQVLTAARSIDTSTFEFNINHTTGLGDPVLWQMNNFGFKFEHVTTNNHTHFIDNNLNNIRLGTNLTGKSFSVSADANDVHLRGGNTGANPYMRIQLHDTLGITVLDSQHAKGMEYEADYSANYTNRSLIDKEYVDTAVNGATQGIDDVLAIGQVLTVDRSINGTGAAQSLRLGDSPTNRLNFFDVYSNSASLSAVNSNTPTQSGGVNLTTTFSQIYTSDISGGPEVSSRVRTEQSQVYMRHDTTISGLVELSVGASSITFTDSINSKGAEYAADYSGNYNARSLVDREYTDKGQLRVVTVATLPTNVAGQVVYVSDESGGAVTAFSDGTNWRRTTDRAIVS
jgi:hypothetical protein